MCAPIFCIWKTENLCEFRIHSTQLLFSTDQLLFTADTTRPALSSFIAVAASRAVQMISLHLMCNSVFVCRMYLSELVGCRAYDGGFSDFESRLTENRRRDEKEFKKQTQALAVSLLVLIPADRVLSAMTTVDHTHTATANNSRCPVIACLHGQPQRLSHWLTGNQAAAKVWAYC